MSILGLTHMGCFHLWGRHLFLSRFRFYDFPQFVQLQVVPINSALTELIDTKFVKAGAIESQDTQINVQKMIEGVCTLVGVNSECGH